MLSRTFRVQGLPFKTYSSAAAAIAGAQRQQNEWLATSEVPTLFRELIVETWRTLDEIFIRVASGRILRIFATSAGVACEVLTEALLNQEFRIDDEIEFDFGEGHICRKSGQYLRGLTGKVLKSVQVSDNMSFLYVPRECLLIGVVMDVTSGSLLLHVSEDH